MSAVYRKELRGFFTGLTGYLFFAFVTCAVGIGSFVLNFSYGYSGFEYVLGNTNIVFLLIIPILTMRSVAEERRQKTDQLLYSLPLRMSGVVLGKYLAMLTVLALPTAVMCVYPLILGQYGTVYYAPAYAAILAFFLLGAALIAVGLFLSALTENQLVAAAVSFAVMVLSYFMGALGSFLPTSAFASFAALSVLVLVTAVLVRLLLKSPGLAMLTGGGLEFLLLIVFLVRRSVFEGAFQAMVNSVSAFERFNSFYTGVLDMGSLVYYVSVAALFVFLTVQAMEKRRWS